MLTAGADSYTWDWKNRLTGSTVGGTTASYAYDGNGLKVSETVGANTTTYVYDQVSGLPMLVDDGTNGYLHAGGLVSQIDGSNAATYPLTDARGSVRGLTDGAGTVTGSSDYAVFGSPRNQSAASNRFGFTGEPTDATTGDVYLRARHYNPSTGRFLSADTVQPNAPGTQGYNRYSYTANNPATWTDPSGHSVGGGNGRSQLPNWPDTVNNFVNTVFGAYIRALATFLSSMDPVTEQRNGTDERVASISKTESAMVLYPMLLAVAAFKLSLGFDVLWNAAGDFVTRALAAAWSVVLKLVAIIGFDVIAKMLVFLAAWNFYTGVVVPTGIVDWTVGEVRTAVRTFPLRPWWEQCKAGAAEAIGQGIIWDTAFGTLFGGSFGPAASGVQFASGTLFDAVIGCMSGTRGGSSAGNPKDPRGVNPPFGKLQPFRGPIKTNGLKGSRKRFYQKDLSRHGGDHMEVYDHRCRHMRGHASCDWVLLRMKGWRSETRQGN